MKNLLLLLLIPFGLQAQGRFNSVTDVNRTANDFLKVLYQQSLFSDTAYTATIHSFKKVKGVKNDTIAAAIALQMDLENRRIIKHTFDSVFMTEFPFCKIVDTVSFEDEYLRIPFEVLHLYVLFTKENKAYSDYNRRDQATYLFKFVKLRNRYLLAGIEDMAPGSSLVRRMLADSRMAGKKMELKFPVVYDEYESRIDHTELEPTILPFRSKSKWGLITMTDSIVFPATADTLYPMKANYRMICIKNRKNLIDTNYRKYFASDVPNLLRGNYYFFSPTHDKGAPLSDFSEDFGFDKVPEMKPGVDYYRSRTYYLVSSDAKIYKPAGITNIQKIEGNFPVTDNRRDRASAMARREVKPVYELKATFNDAESYIFTLYRKSGEKLKEFKGYRNMYLWNDRLIAEKGDSTFILEPDGTIIFSTAFETYYDVLRDKKELHLFDRSTGFYGLYIPETKLYIKPEYRNITISATEKPYFLVVTPDYNYGFIKPDGTKLFD